MSKPKAKRDKAYRPKGVRIPVTSLRDEFGIVLHSCIVAARNGHFDKSQFDRIGQAINCVWGALYLKPPKDISVMTVVEGAMRAMNDVSERGDATGHWLLRDFEQAAVLAGIRKIEEQLPYMDVMMLYRAMQEMKTLSLAERTIRSEDIQSINILNEKTGEIIRIERAAVGKLTNHNSKENSSETNRI
jgi:hypothetical protein